MKAKHAVIAIALGFCLTYASAFRFTGRSEAGALLVIGTLLKIGGILLLAYKVVSYEGFRKFMNR